MIESVSIKVNENVFIKDPKTSDLGQRIVSAAIDMIVDRRLMRDKLFSVLSKLHHHHLSNERLVNL
jgi:hypothetical protein